MNKKFLSIIATIISGIILVSSCSDDFLDQQPVGSLSSSILTSEDGVEGLLIGAYSLLNGTIFPATATSPDNLLSGVIRGAEAFKGSDAGDQPAMLEYNKFNVTTGNSNTQNEWIHLFNAISRCNETLAVLATVEDIDATRKVEIEAEARFLRAHYYFNLKRDFNNVPWIDETAEDVKVSNTVDNDGSTFVNIWPQIAADLDFARKNLPDTQTELARPNKSAADAYYAKVLIYRANFGEYSSGYSEALTVLNDVIASGQTAAGEAYGLVDSYHDLFDCSTENSKEIVWAVQNSVNDGTPASTWAGNYNTYYPSIWIGSQSPSGPSLGTGWGFMNPTPYFADHFRTEDGLPMLDMYDNIGTRLKSDYGLAAAPSDGSADSYEVGAEAVDPRLDWSLGRRGIPFLDYGDMPGASWIRNQGHGGPYLLKKQYIMKSQVGTYSAPGLAGTALNVNIIRFADVLLLAAECEARVGSLDNARSLVNQVRERMAINTDGWVKKDDGTDAANYQIAVYPTGGASDPFQSIDSALDAVLFERALELGTEGHRFYDVVRFGEGSKIFNAFVDAEKVIFDYMGDAVYSDNPDMYLPIPRDAVDRSKVAGVATLTQENY